LPARPAAKDENKVAMSPFALFDSTTCWSSEAITATPYDARSLRIIVFTKSHFLD
jgi:hypothetical protein